MPFAHSRNAVGDRHDLVEHLRSVARMAGDFAERFGAREVATYLGLWHDIGKFHPSFQAYLAECEAGTARTHGPDHKAAGCMLGRDHLSLAALAIQAHHGGLCSPSDFKGWLERMASGPDATEALRLAAQEISDLEPPRAIEWPSHVANDALQAELWLRMLFSSLVDADYLDTERHFARARSDERSSTTSIGELCERFGRNHARLVTGQASDAVSHVRHQVYDRCVRAAGLPQGLFRLTVPTGGGKTLSAMAFALRHAAIHNLDRVVVAVPYMTITEQTADVYRSVLGGEPLVLEHHSGADWGHAPDEDYRSTAVWSKLASENWDAPVIVTTTVQLFESLFSRATSKARKLHRLARSVVILDEVQALPTALLDPILDALRQLVSDFGTSIVLSTATQPAFDSIPALRDLPTAELVPDHRDHFAALQRVVYEWAIERPMAWPEVAALMLRRHQALAVMNTKRDAISLLDALGDQEALHLSTLLCGMHRREVVAEVKRRLAAGEPCRLVATQVVESGVDLDFPLVVRAVGPLDGIIQAAGRCNRNGRLDHGEMIVIDPEGGGAPQGPYRAATNIARSMLAAPVADPGEVGFYQEYSRKLFRSLPTDAHGIQGLRRVLDFPEVARRFRMIDDDTVTVVVRHGTSDQRSTVRHLLDELSAGQRGGRQLLRRIQPWTVALRAREADRYRTRGLIVPVVPGVEEWIGHYDPVRGLVGAGVDPDLLVV